MDEMLSPKQLAEAIGVSESSLKRWVDEGRIPASRTAGGHRRIRLPDAVRFLRQTHIPVLRPERLGLDGATPTTGEDDPTETLYAALHTGDLPRVKGLVCAAYLEGRPLADLFDGPLRECLSRLGELWQHSNDGIFIEHRAIDMSIQALDDLRTIMPRPDDDAPAAVGATPGGDPYLIPSIMASMVLTDAGYAATNLGPDMPFDVLLSAARQHRAKIAWLSVSSPMPPRQLANGLIKLADGLAECDAVLVVGGRALPRHAARGHDNVQQVGSMSELAAYARGRRGQVAEAGHKLKT